MRTTTICVLIAAVCGGPAFAEARASAADRIRDLYHAVPDARVRASPQVDIRAHIEQMRARRGSGEDRFAVPDLDIETVMRETGTEDVLMNPTVLEAIARMPADRAAQVLRMIEDRRAGLSPLEDVPPLSLSEAEPAPENLALRGWRLGRDGNGAPFLQKGEDAASRLPLVPSMILADFGRVLSIQDDAEAFRVTLESGDVLEGEVAQAVAATEAPILTDEVIPDPSAVAAVADEVAPGTVVRPEARAETPGPEPQAGRAQSDPAQSGPPFRSPRPRARPADLVTDDS